MEAPCTWQEQASGELWWLSGGIATYEGRRFSLSLEISSAVVLSSCSAGSMLFGSGGTRTVGAAASSLLWQGRDTRLGVYEARVTRLSHEVADAGDAAASKRCEDARVCHEGRGVFPGRGYRNDDAQTLFTQLFPGFPLYCVSSCIV